VFGRGVKQGKTGEKGARRFGSCAPGCHGPNVETVGYYRESLPSAEAVAQVSKPAVSRVSKPANRCQYQARRRIPRPADLEVGDTAGLETCATYEADPGARTLSIHFPKGPAPARTPCYRAFASETVRFPGTSRAEKLP